MGLVDSKVEQWKSHLLDLSKRNRLLYFRQLKRGNVLITEPEAEGVFQYLVIEGHKLTIDEAKSEQPALTGLEEEPALVEGDRPVRPGTARTGLSGPQLAATLYSMWRKARTALEEQGVNVLFLTFGMLEWYESESSSEKVLSPIVMVPVTIERASVTKPYSVELLDEDVLVNPTLALKMQNDFGFAIPEAPTDWEQTSLSAYLDGLSFAMRKRTRWSVRREVYLGLFSFEKLVMLKDITDHAQEVKEHPLVAALAGQVSEHSWSSADLTVDNLDRALLPQDTFQVLDADSSQQEALLLAKRGVSFVVQGPPGTGKSQTIVNLIAESLAQGKQVLFVSEKMAALEVVYKRLQECGLDEFCLEAHSHKANKKAIVAQLGKALDAHETATRPADPAALEQLQRVRNKLNEYAQALHAPVTALRRTPYRVHGELAAVQHLPDMYFSLDRIGDIDEQRLAMLKDAVSSLARFPGLLADRESHPWRATTVTTLSFQTYGEIRGHLTALMRSLLDLGEMAEQAASRLGLPQPQSRPDFGWVADVLEIVVLSPSPPTSWLSATADLSTIRAALASARQTQANRARGIAWLETHHTDAIYALDNLSELADRFHKKYRSALRVLVPGYGRDKKAIQATALGTKKINYKRARKAVRLAAYVCAAERWYEAESESHVAMFGDYYNAVDTQWDRVGTALEWTEHLRARFASAPIPDKTVALVCDTPDSIRMLSALATEFRQVLAAADRELEYFAMLFAPEWAVPGSPAAAAAPLAMVIDAVRLRLDHLQDLGTWLEFQQAIHGAVQVGLDSFLDEALAGTVGGTELLQAFLKRFYQLWLDVVYDTEPALGNFRGAAHDELVNQFRVLDIGQMDSARRRIVAKLAALRPTTSWMEAPSSEVAILRREVEKKKRHKPIRRLFAEISHLLPAIKPCLMMSPLSVSQFLSASRVRFDVVVFDEASQICPEDAVTALMRGGQAVVAGDRHQLPPTPFFKSLGLESDEESEDQGSEVLESLLQEWSVTMPTTMLRWHYRSRDESLIAFSNHTIYDDRLITFPNARLEDETQGIRFVYVADGIYDRGHSRTNRREAKRVAELVVEHFGAFSERSLGVVAFSEAQREAIDNELELMARDRPELEQYLYPSKSPDAFFVKNLENVQGDERDVMFFSVGYGRDNLGRMTMNFGPLNGEDGIRRLNVAITRARYQVKLVSSILPEDIDAAHPNPGVQMLRNYLNYARHNGHRDALFGVTNAVAGAEGESGFEDAVYESLTRAGLVVQKQVGCSGYRIDLAVVDQEHPGRYLLGIECDGATYHSSRTARDRDRLRQQVLEDLGWTIHRIWSRDWVANPDAQVQAVLASVEHARQTPLGPVRPRRQSKLATSTVTQSAGAPPVVRERPQRAEAHVRSLPAPTRPANVSEYKSARLKRQGNFQDFYSAGSIHPVLLQLVQEEGPIHQEVACRKVAACWGISRVGHNVQARIMDGIRRLAADRRLVVREGFLWMPDQTHAIVRQPPMGESARPIDHIALEEIEAAVLLCLTNSFSLTPDDLIMETARLLCYDRVGENIKQRIGLAIKRLVTARRIRSADGKFELA